MNNKIQMNVSLKDTTKISCEKCDNETFSEGLMLRRVSRFLTGTEKDGVIPIPVFYCSKCQHINEEFMPKDREDSSSGMNVVK